MNYHHLLNEYILHNFSRFLSSITNCQEQLKTMQETVKKRKCTSFLRVCIMSLISLFLNKISLPKSFCSLRSVFQRAMYDASNFFLVLAIFEAFERTDHVKQWFQPLPNNQLYNHLLDLLQLNVNICCHTTFDWSFPPIITL